MDEAQGAKSAPELIATSRAAFTGALGRGDTRAAASVYAEDALLLPPSAAPLRGRSAIERFWQAGVDAGITAVELASDEVETDTEVAYDIGRYTFHLDPRETGPVIDRGRYLVVHRRTADGSWSRAAEMFSPDLPEAVGRPTAVR